MSGNVPAIRFAGFTEPWEQRKLGGLCAFDKGRGYSKADIRESGTPLVLYGRLYTHYESVIKGVDTFAEPKDGSLYSHGGEVVVPGSGETAEDIAVASHIASSGILLGGDLNVITPSPAIDSSFLAIEITSGSPHYQLATKAQGKSVVHIHNEDIADVDFSYPTPPEQRQIGTLFSCFDGLITLHQRKHDQLATLKKSLLDKMFPKPGSDVPELRFAGFTEPWEQRKLGELGCAQSGVGFPDAEQGGSEGVPFFKVSDMKTLGNERELVHSNNYVTENQIARMGWHPVTQVPAIFFAKVGAAVMLNRKRLVNEPFLLDNNTMAFSMDTKALDPTFGQPLFERLDLTSLIQVGALPSYNASDVEDLDVLLPISMVEQQLIGQVFTNLDNLITLHQREPPF